MLTSLEAIEAIAALLLLNHQILRHKILIFNIRQKLDAKLILSIKGHVEVSVVLPSEPIRILLRNVYLCSFRDIRRMKKRIPRLIKSLEGK